MGKDLKKIAWIYDIVAKEYAKKFYGEHEMRPKDVDVLFRFSQEVMGKQPIWDFGCGPGKPRNI